MTAAADPTPAYVRLRPQRQHWWWWALMGLVAVVLLVTSAGGPPTEGVSDDRLFSIAERIKCTVCVGESVGGSSAPIAVQFREEIANQMAAGRTDDEILNFFSDSYGRDILLTPPSSGVGALVWIVPVVVLAGAVLLLASTFGRWRGERADRAATDADQQIVDAALDARRDGGGT